MGSPVDSDAAAWWQEHGAEVASGRVSYEWPPGETSRASIERRQALAKRCHQEVRRTGTLNSELGAEIMAWGFNGATAAIDNLEPRRFERTMAEAYPLADRGEIARAAAVVVELPNIGISSASKLLALPSDGQLTIYDHRMAKALAGLEVAGSPIPVPAGRSERGTSTSNAVLCRGYEQYSLGVELLLDQASRDCSASKVLRSLDDVEMGLFMKGRTE